MYSWSYGVRDIVDGTANTVAYSESITGKPNAGNLFRGNSTQGVNDPGAQLTNAQVSPAVVLKGLQACADAFKNNQSIQTNKGQMWAFGARAYTLFQTIQTPDDSTYPFGCAGCGLDQSWAVPASRFPSGGVNVLMADGSVRFVKDSINRQTWWNIGTRDGNEAVSSDSY